MNTLIFVAITSMICETSGTIHPIIGVGTKGVYKCVTIEETIQRPEKFSELRPYYYFKCLTHSNSGSEYRAANCDVSGVREGCVVSLTDGRSIKANKSCRALVGAK